MSWLGEVSEVSENVESAVILGIYGASHDSLITNCSCPLLKLCDARWTVLQNLRNRSVNRCFPNPERSKRLYEYATRKVSRVKHVLQLLWIDLTRLELYAQHSKTTTSSIGSANMYADSIVLCR